MEEITQISTEVKEMMKEIVVAPVTNREEYAHAGDVGKMVSNKIKALNEKRLGMTRPLDDTKKQIMAEFDKMIAPLEKFLSDTKSAMLTFHRQEEARVQEEQRKERERIAAEEKAAREKAEAERKAADAEGIPDLGEPIQRGVEPAKPQVPAAPTIADIKTERGKYATSTVKANWTFEIIDADAVPREFCEPSKDHIRQSIAAGAREIKGVRIWDAGTVALR